MSAYCKLVIICEDCRTNYDLVDLLMVSSQIYECVNIDLNPRPKKYVFSILLFQLFKTRI